MPAVSVRSSAIPHREFLFVHGYVRASNRRYGGRDSDSYLKLWQSFH